jgi:carboxylate-amine ligase
MAKKCEMSSPSFTIGIEEEYQIEIGPAVHETIRDARADLVSLRQAVNEAAGRKGLKIAAAGTHPFSSWQKSQITPFDRYLGQAKDMGVLAQQLLIFGTHVRIGVEDPELRIDLMNQARNYLAPLLALSTSSPFWEGRDTGLKSYRRIVFRSVTENGEALNRSANGNPPEVCNNGWFEVR